MELKSLLITAQRGRREGRQEKKEFSWAVLIVSQLFSGGKGVNLQVIWKSEKKTQTLRIYQKRTEPFAFNTLLNNINKQY